MTNNIKYQRPIPIKAQSGRVLDLSDNNAQKAKQENARRKAKSDYYFDQAPSIPNLAKGIYYWATSEPMLFGKDETPYVTKGVAPAVGATPASAVKSIPQAINWAKQSLPGLAFLSSWLGSKSVQPSSRVQSTSLPMSISRSRLLDKAEEATRDSTATAPRDSVSTTTPSSGSNNENNNRDKKESTFKKESKKVIKNIGNVYGKVLKGGAYGVGFVGVPGGIVYGIHQATKPAPTAVDSLLDQQSRQMMELNKLQQAKQNQAQIEALKQQLYNTKSPQTQNSPSPTPQTNTTTLTLEQLDSLNNIFREE